MNKSFHIIIADDDEDDQMIFKSVVGEFSSGIKVTSVNNGVQLFEFLTPNKQTQGDVRLPDVIILDINMPILNGIETLAKLKESERLKKIPVFMLSTMRTIDRVSKSESLGAINYYTKPNQLHKYRPILKEILDQTMYAERISP